MNSRLNVALRERRGLVYNVESNLTSYTDTGAFCIYFGTDPEDVDTCLKLIIMQKGFSHTQCVVLKIIRSNTNLADLLEVANEMFAEEYLSTLIYR